MSVYGAYLDIETTGLFWQYTEITVIGMYLVKGADGRRVQPVLPSRLTLLI